MLILLYILFGLLFFDCLLVCCLYFRNGIPFEQDEEYSSYRETLKSTKQGIKLLKVTGGGKKLLC
jgi:hypothetical protein